ncbi:MAG TPA: DUF2520 domain-containing protein [Thermoanaerobaculia bacterium]|nr:DUF2520 domain-containing protein [Thermoanaerobaculia bacterium]
MRLGIVGGGRAAWAFGSTWRRIGWPLSGVALRSESAVSQLAPGRTTEELARDSELILIAVSDRSIEEVAASIPPTNAIVFHPSGILTSVRGGFSLHPLKSLPPVGEPSDLNGALLVFEGAHRDIAGRIADAAGARFAEIAPEQKPLYHAAAVFGSNYIAALLDIAESLIGIEHAREDLAALAESAIDNWRAHTDARRFTGPAARGDRAVLERHLEALQRDPAVAELYRILAERILATRK